MGDKVSLGAAPVHLICRLQVEPAPVRAHTRDQKTEESATGDEHRKEICLAETCLRKAGAETPSVEKSIVARDWGLRNVCFCRLQVEPAPEGGTPGYILEECANKGVILAKVTESA